MYFTVGRKDLVPGFVMQRIFACCRGYRVTVFDDEECRAFLEREYTAEHRHTFDAIARGAHKADFFRYCLLYRRGGYYFDIKTDFRAHVSEFHPPHVHNLFTTTLSSTKGTVYNGTLACPAGNPMLLEQIRYIMQNPRPGNYHAFTRKLYETVQACSDAEVSSGKLLQSKHDDWKIFLHREHSLPSPETDEEQDRYGARSMIHDEQTGRVLARTRYINHRGAPCRIHTRDRAACGRRPRRWPCTRDAARGSACSCGTTITYRFTPTAALRRTKSTAMRTDTRLFEIKQDGVRTASHTSSGSPCCSNT